MTVRKVGTCRIIRELGRGGMGVVYEAFQEGLDRRVAVKTLDQKVARSKDVTERFRREGRAYAQLRHQGVLAVHDLVEKDETLYLVTEFVDGADLARILSQGALPPAAVAVIGARVAEALDYVHFNKLLHRDVKPANIMISRDGDVKLMDFGIAKALDASDLTRVGMLVGSPSYLAPEVLAGDAADPRSDIWALGVTLYELVTGEKPFKGSDADALFAAIRIGSFQPIRAIAPHVPRRLARAIERCLERKPRRRWRSAGALARELQACSGRLLRGMHPQARLVAFMANRGYEKEEEALTRVDAESLRATRGDDRTATTGSTRTLPASPLAPGWRWALVAAVAVAAGATAWLIRM